MCVTMSRFIEDITNLNTNNLRFHGHIFVTSLAQLSNLSQPVEVKIKIAFLYFYLYKFQAVFPFLLKDLSRSIVRGR